MRNDPFTFRLRIGGYVQIQCHGVPGMILAAFIGLTIAVTVPLWMHIYL